MKNLENQEAIKAFAYQLDNDIFSAIVKLNNMMNLTKETGMSQENCDKILSAFCTAKGLFVQIDCIVNRYITELEATEELTELGE